ncbi:hypothetical protein FOA52_002447 [Chlamydomonas sp. UWO 241]|nr:hypothetical protein FOA52_002447 [Chlamydomonas sp. UWO 241]
MGTMLEAWLYLPNVPHAHEEQPAHGGEEEAGVEAPPQPPASVEAGAQAGHKCIILAHGLGGQRDFGLHQYAGLFAENGFAALVFDYRCFGGSDGEPRNWVSPSRHVEDWDAALAAVQPGGKLSATTRLNCTSVGLWGSSFSGGHILVTAANAAAASPPQPLPVRAVVSQVPHLSGVAATKSSLERRGLIKSVLMLIAGAHDVIRAWAGRSAAYVRLVGPPGSMAVMIVDEDEERAYFAKHPAVKLHGSARFEGGWQPWAPARLLLEVSRYSPVARLNSFAAPVMFVAASRDTLCPTPVIRDAAASCPDRCALHEYDVSHFSLYGGETFADASRRMVKFYGKHL